MNTPYDVLSVSNLSNPNPISGTVNIKRLNGQIVATAPLPSIPPEGAAGFLLLKRAPGDPLGLFPGAILLPADSDGVFHGILEVILTGLNNNGGRAIVLAQEFNGYAMLNLPVFRSAN